MNEDKRNLILKFVLMLRFINYLLLIVSIDVMINTTETDALKVTDAVFDYDIPLKVISGQTISSCAIGRFNQKRSTVNSHLSHNVIASVIAYSEFELEPMMCTGIIISLKHVIVPAVCVTNKYRETIPIRNVTVKFLSQVVFNEIEAVVAKIFVHEQYSLERTSTFRHNIALVKIIRGFHSRITTPCMAFLHSKSFYNFKEVVILNYKSLCGFKNNRTMTDIYVTKHRAIDPCALHYMTSKDLICILNYNLEGHYSPQCSNDIGSPIKIEQAGTGFLILVGMVVHVDTRYSVCGAPGSNNIALKVYPHRDWIKEKMDKYNLASCEI